MPFTLSHPAAVLPFLHTPLLPAGLVIGSMVPDLPYFLPLGIPRTLTHSLVGSVTVDLAMGLLAFAVWRFVLRAPLRDFGPRWLRERWHPDAGAGVIRTIALLVLSLLVGIATHQVWDSFTHPDGWVVLRVAFLRGELGSSPVWHWAQYASGAFGLLVILIWTAGWVRRTVPRPAIYSRTSAWWRRTTWIAVVAVLAATALVVWLPAVVTGTKPLDPVIVFHTVVYSIAAAGAVALVICFAWYLLPARESIKTEPGRLEP